MVPHQAAEVTYEATINGKVYRIRVEKGTDAVYTVDLDGQRYVVDARRLDGTFYSFIIDGRTRQADIKGNGEEISVCLGGETWRVRVESAARRGPMGLSPKGTVPKSHARQIVSAPIPGKVVKVAVALGEKVRKGQGLIVLEAMKMENELISPIDGEVKEISVNEGQTVEAGVSLLTVESAPQKMIDGKTEPAHSPVVGRP